MTDILQTERDRTDLLERLTDGERQCLDLVAKGMVSKEIARSLDISPHTVDARLRVATRKLGARNRFAAAQLLIAFKNNDLNSVGSLTSNLIYEDLSLPQKFGVDKMGPSTGGGYDPDDLPSDTGSDVSDKTDISQSDWVKPSHPFAKFFGGENRLSVGRRLMLIMGTSIGAAMAFAAVVNSLIGMSQLLSSP